MSRQLPQNVTAGQEIEIQIAPFGDYPCVVDSPGGKAQKVTQHLDDAAFARILADFNPGTKAALVDLDHDSFNEGGSTRAAAWITALRIDETDGLMATFKFTPMGAELVTGREYRFVSPVFFGDGKGRIDGLHTVALTNQPNLPVRAILNRARTGISNVEEPQKENTDMDPKLIDALGLGPDATVDDAVAAVAQLKGQVAALNEEKADAEAEKFACENADKFEKDALKNAYKANKEVALAMVNAAKSPAKPEAPAQTILNSGTTPPAITPGKDARAMLNALPPSKRAKFYAEHRDEIDNN